MGSKSVNRSRAAAYVVVADGCFDMHGAKTACSLIRYRPQEVSAVLDRSTAGQSVQQVVGFGGDIPIVADLEAALALGANRLLIGVSPPGGQLPDEWRRWLVQALEAGIDLYSGLHVLLNDDPDLVALARESGAGIFDLRAVPRDLSTPSGLRSRVEIPVVLGVGSDCNVGKMTALVELQSQARAAGLEYGFAATGQTGVLLEGRGMAIDRVISDFVAGAAERLTCEAAEGAQLVLVEGQGSLVHPFYSGVTLGLLHGCRPDAQILCHVVGRQWVRHAQDLAIPPLARLVEIYEEAASWIAPSPVIGVALATYSVGEGEAHEALENVARETGLPVEDPVRFPNGKLLDACERLRS